MRRIALLITVLCFFGTVKAQIPSIAVNGKAYSAKGTCGFIPEKLFYKSRAKGVKVSKGSFKLMRGSRVISTITISSRTVSRSLNGLREKVQGGDKILLEVSEILVAGKKKSVNGFKKLEFDKKLYYQQNPFFDILINGDVKYKVDSIKKSEAKTIEIVTTSTDVWRATYQRVKGSRPVNYPLGLSLPLTISLLDKAQTGERLVLGFENTKTGKKIYYSIPIKPE